MHMVQVIHHVNVRETAITPLPILMRWSGMSENWDKDLPSEGMKAKVNRKCHVSFVSLGWRRLAWLLRCCLFHISYRARSWSRSWSQSRSGAWSQSQNSPTMTPHPWFPLSNSKILEKCLIIPLKVTIAIFGMGFSILGTKTFHFW